MKITYKDILALGGYALIFLSLITCANIEEEKRLSSLLEDDSVEEIDLDSFIDEYEEEYLLYDFIKHKANFLEIDEDIVIAMMFTENERLDPNPKSYNPQDVGLMQLNKKAMPDFQKYVGNHFDPYIVEHNVQAAMYHIRWLLMRPGVSVANIARAYNQGYKGAIIDKKEMNHITKAHTKRFNQHYYKLKNGEKEWYVNRINSIKNWEY